ncbi:MAG: DUF4286 family protein [Woeseiaceae bacterium]
MTTQSGPIYEVTIFVERERIADCEQRLEEHVRETLRDPNIADCRVFAIANDETGRAGRICQHVLDASGDLDGYLDGPAADMEAEITARFGDDASVHSRLLREDQTYDLPISESPNCLNCGTHLRGQYCGHCGQRSRSRLISLWELITDAFGDLFEIDSRLWQTVVPMMVRPGRLTHDYLQGRRARFMPPFRMYLVMSLIFFVIAFFDPREELGLFFEPPSDAEIAAQEDEQDDSMIVMFNDNEGVEIEDDCDIEADDIEGLPGFLARRLTVERMQHACEKIRADEGKSLTAKIIDGAPAALILLLPIMALVLKALYPLSRRYYVEHLLFFVHFHAFAFLLLTIQILLIRLATLLRVPELVSTLTIVAMSIYIPVYIFLAMRRVYEQGRIVTFLKFVVLAVTYVAGFSLIIAATTVMAMFAI